MLAPSSIKNPPEIECRGYVVKSLEASLWVFYDSQSFEEECLMAVNLGNDSNTYWVAVYGQNHRNITAKMEFLKSGGDRLVQNELIRLFADKLVNK